MTYRPDIDGLRALAVLAVVLHHTGLGFPGGYVGVDVFFVISGYLIASLMLHDLDAGKFSLAHFWERRIRRIAPALVVVVAASFVLGWFVLVPKAYEMFGRSVVNLAALRSNEFFARHTGYFEAAAEEKPLLHTWSLAVEEQFYLLVPLVFWGVARLRRRTWLAPLVALAATASFIYAIRATTPAGGAAYFQLSTRAWEPLAGVLTALLLRKPIEWPQRARESAGWIGLIAILSACFYCDSKTPFPGVATLAPVAGAVLLIVSGHSTARMTTVHRLLASRAAVGIGLISYSLYLWHWPLLVFIKCRGVVLLSTLERALPVVVAGILAYLTYRFVEQPFRRRERLASGRQLFAATAAAFLLLVGAGSALRITEGVAWRLPEQARQFVVTSLQENRFNQNHVAADVPHRLLRLGASDVAPRILVWGDSHAMAVLPAIDEACRAAGIAAEGAVGVSRPPILRHSTQASVREQEEADAFGRAVIKHVRTSEIEVVLLAAIWNSYFGSPQFEVSLVETVRELRAAGKQVYFLRHVPTFDVNVGPRLVHDAWHGRDLTKLSITVDRYAAQCRSYEAVQATLVGHGVKVLDPLPYLRAGSTGDLIAPFDAGGSFYLDANHLSAYGARTVGPVFAPMIDDVASLRQTAERKPVSPQLNAREPTVRR